MRISAVRHGHVTVGAGRSGSELPGRGRAAREGHAGGNAEAGLSGMENCRSVARRSWAEELQGVVTVVDEEDAVNVRGEGQPEEVPAGTCRIDLR